MPPDRDHSKDSTEAFAATVSAQPIKNPVIKRATYGGYRSRTGSREQPGGCQTEATLLDARLVPE